MIEPAGVLRDRRQLSLALKFLQLTDLVEAVDPVAVILVIQPSLVLHVFDCAGQTAAGR